MGADFDPNTGGGAGLRTLYGSLGRGGYEGIHPDDRGNILIVEDVGGSTVPRELFLGSLVEIRIPSFTDSFPHLRTT